MDLFRVQKIILQFLNQSDSDEELQQHHSDSECEDNMEQELHIAADEPSACDIIHFIPGPVDEV